MAKTLSFEFEGNKYTLEYSRRTEKMMEMTGFDIDKIDTMPQTMFPEMFAGAFLKNHRGIDRKLVDRIYDELVDKRELFAKLAEMYKEPMDELIEKQGNLTWEANF